RNRRFGLLAFLRFGAPSSLAARLDRFALEGGGRPCYQGRHPHRGGALAPGGSWSPPPGARDVLLVPCRGWHCRRPHLDWRLLGAPRQRLGRRWTDGAVDGSLAVGSRFACHQGIRASYMTKTHEFAPPNPPRRFPRRRCDRQTGGGGGG